MDKEDNSPDMEFYYEVLAEAGQDIDEEDQYQDNPRKKRIFRLTVVLTILAFIGLSYAWVPLLLPPHLDFLNQNRTLAEEDLVIQSKPAIVNIHANKPGTVSNSQGTGFNLHPEGLIVTNRHVVESATSVEVTFLDDRRFISQDIQYIAGYDMALIKLKGNELPSLTVVSDRPKIGETVTIIGNPRGFQRISARGEVENYYKADDMLVFGINAPIAPGSSGSPVLNGSGDVVGIIYATRTYHLDGQDQQQALAMPTTALTPFI